MVIGQDVGALGHEMDTLEDDELRLRMSRSLLGELERVARDVGELDDLIASRPVNPQGVLPEGHG